MHLLVFHLNNDYFFSFLSQQRSDINKSHMIYSRKRGFGPFSQLQHLMEFKQKNKGNFETKQLVLCLSVCDLHVWCTNENKRAMRGFERIKKTICRLFFFLLNMLFDWLHLCAAAKMCSQGGAVYHYPHKFWIPWIALHGTNSLKWTALNRKPQ